MDYFGWTLSARLFTGDAGWIEAMNLDREFEPDAAGWSRIFRRIDEVMDRSGLGGKAGAALHFSHDVAPLIERLGLAKDFHDARVQRPVQKPFDLGIHARFQDDELVNTPRFPAIFKEDIGHAARFNASTLVEHPPVGTRDTIEETVAVLASDWFCNLLDEFPGITIAWENKADYATNRRFFGSLAKMLEFRDALVDLLRERGRDALAERHQFCFDTGHLLTWRGTAGSTTQADREIDRYLPLFARHVKVFHFQANDGIVDGHITPFSKSFLNHPSRTRMDVDKVITNFNVLKTWIKMCKNEPHPAGQHLFLETGTLPFSLDQYVEFGKELEKHLH